MPSMNFFTADETVLSCFGLETVQSRFDTLAINFFLKLTQNPKSLASRVLEHAFNNPDITMWHNGLVITPFTTDIKHRMSRYSNNMAQNLYSLDNILDPKDSKDIITNVIKIHDRIAQCKRINERVKRHEHDLKTIDTSQANPLESLIMKSIDFSVTNNQDIFSPVSDIINTTKIKPITRIDKPRLLHRIIPNSVQPYKFQIWRHIISRNDWNWRWHHYIYNTECTRCNQTTDQTLTHELLTCDKTSSIRDSILQSLYDMLTKHITSDNKLISLLHKITLDLFQLDDGETQELLQFLIAPHLANIQSEYLTAVIRSHLIVLAAATLPIFKNQFNYDRHITVKTSNTKQNVIIDIADYLQYNLFTIANINQQTIVTNCNKFAYWKNDDNPPFLGSSTSRKNNPVLQSQAQEYANHLLQKHQGNLWIFSDGSVAGNDRNIVGGGYVIAQSHKNQTEVSNDLHQSEPTYNILKQQSITLPKCSIALAELTSLLAALLNLKQNSSINQLNNNITAFCDNKYVVDIINDKRQANQLLIPNLQKVQETIFLLSQKINIKVIWIPAHCGVKLHDLADKLATTAHSNQKATRGSSLGKVGLTPP